MEIGEKGMRYIFFFIFTATSFFVSAENIILNINEKKTVSGAKINSKYPLKHFNIRKKKFLLASFEYVEKIFGPTESFTISPGKSISPKAKCYYSGKKNDPTLIVFTSGPMGGFGHVTSGIQIMRDRRDFTKLEKCTASKLIDKDLSFRNGLNLGMKAKQAKKIFRHKPTYEKNDLIVYYYIKKDIVPRNKKRNIDAINYCSISIIIKNDKVESIHINAGETN